MIMKGYYNMKRINEKKKKNIIRIIMLVMALLMIMSFVLLPAANSVSAEEITDVVVDSFETGKLSEAIEKAKDGTDLNLIKKIAVSGGTLNAQDYAAICGYPNIEFLELAGCDTENGIVPEGCLQSRNQLTYISLPKNTETIGTRALAGNRVLLKVSIPSTLRHIGDYAFEGCESVEQFSVPAELETMGTAAFSDCKALKSFELPEAITEIPDYCFSKCSFTEMHFGPQIKSVGNGAFSDCHDLTDIYFYGDTAFSASESAFQNLKVTIHTYDGGEGFKALDTNFVDISYDLSEDSVYTPPKSAAPASDDKKEETSAQTTSAQTEALEETEVQTEITESSAEEAKPVSSEPASSFSNVSVIVIAVLCAVIGVLAGIIIAGKKKN